MNHKDNEDFLYAFIDELSRENAPIIFKGGLALKDVLNIYNHSLDVERKTVDIDGNWIDVYNKEKIQKTLSNALNKIDSSLSLKLSREPGEKRAMGFDIITQDGEIFTSIDLDIKDNPFYIECVINDVNRKYSSFEKMLADKLYAISKEHVFRRIKDILDIYLILETKEVDTKDILKILKYDKRILGDFSTMLKSKDIIEKSYNKMNRILNKPDFNIVWNKVTKYIEKIKEN